jgi:GNAT superfamily N-acetyltransferase
VVEVQPLSRRFDRVGFDCGVSVLNTFLQATALQHQEKGISRTFVLVEPESNSPNRILGYFTLSACEATSSSLPEKLAKKFPRNIPAVLLGRLAVDKDLHGRGYGGALVFEVIRRVAAASIQIGIAGLFVDAKDKNAVAFYERFGFELLPTDEHRLFLPLPTLIRIAELEADH